MIKADTKRGRSQVSLCKVLEVTGHLIFVRNLVCDDTLNTVFLRPGALIKERLTAWIENDMIILTFPNFFEYNFV